MSPQHNELPISTPGDRQAGKKIFLNLGADDSLRREAWGGKSADNLKSDYPANTVKPKDWQALIEFTLAGQLEHNIQKDLENLQKLQQQNANDKKPTVSNLAKKIEQETKELNERLATAVKAADKLFEKDKNSDSGAERVRQHILQIENERKQLEHELHIDPKLDITQQVRSLAKRNPELSKVLEKYFSIAGGTANKKIDLSLYIESGSKSTVAEKLDRYLAICNEQQRSYLLEQSRSLTRTRYGEAAALGLADLGTAYYLLKQANHMDQEDNANTPFKMIYEAVTAKSLIMQFKQDRELQDILKEADHMRIKGDMQAASKLYERVNQIADNMNLTSVRDSLAIPENQKDSQAFNALTSVLEHVIEARLRYAEFSNHQGNFMRAYESVIRLKLDIPESVRANEQRMVRISETATDGRILKRSSLEHDFDLALSPQHKDENAFVKVQSALKGIEINDREEHTTLEKITEEKREIAAQLKQASFADQKMLTDKLNILQSEQKWFEQGTESKLHSTNWRRYVDAILYLSKNDPEHAHELFSRVKTEDPKLAQLLNTEDSSSEGQKLHLLKVGIPGLTLDGYLEITRPKNWLERNSKTVILLTAAVAVAIATWGTAVPVEAAVASAGGIAATGSGIVLGGETVAVAFNSGIAATEVASLGAEVLAAPEVIDGGLAAGEVIQTTTGGQQLTWAANAAKVVTTKRIFGAVGNVSVIEGMKLTLDPNYKLKDAAKNAAMELPAALLVGTAFANGLKHTDWLIANYPKVLAIGRGLTEASPKALAWTIALSGTNEVINCGLFGKSTNQARHDFFKDLGLDNEMANGVVRLVEKSNNKLGTALIVVPAVLNLAFDAYNNYYKQKYSVIPRPKSLPLDSSGEEAESFWQNFVSLGLPDDPPALQPGYKAPGNK